MSDWVSARSPRERDKVEYDCREMTEISGTPEQRSKQVCLLDDGGLSPYFTGAKRSKKVDATEYREQLKTRCDAAGESKWALVVPATGKAEDGGVLLGIDYSGYGGVVKQLPEEMGCGGCSPPPKDAFLIVSGSPMSSGDDECCAVHTVDECGLGSDECDGVCFTPQGENSCAATAAALSEPPAINALAASYHQAADEPECRSAMHLPVMLEAMEDVGFPEAETATPVISNPPSPVGRPMQCSDDGADESFLPASDELTPIKAPPAHMVSQRFLQLKFLGEGQFGKAYIVRHNSCSSGEEKEEEEDEVLKIILSEKYRAEEYDLPYKYPHEYVVRMLRKERIGLYTYLFQEYVRGQALEELWAENRQRGRTLNDADLDVLGYQMLDALRHLGNHRIVHRDIKPSNIIRGYSSGRGTQYKLIDFGLSEQLMDEERVRCVKGFRGSYAYSAPECCRLCPLSKTCQDGYNTKADEWSLAVTLVQMCSFQVPWHHYVRDWQALLYKLLTEPHLMQEYAGNEMLVHCSPWWRQVLVSMLSPRPAGRPDVGELLDSMDKKQRDSLPDFGLLSEEMADCTSVDADMTCECNEYKCNRLFLPDFEQLQE